MTRPTKQYRAMLAGIRNDLVLALAVGDQPTATALRNELSYWEGEVR